MERGQFTFYNSFYRALRRIRKKSARADAYDAICAYALLGIEPDMEKMEDAAAIAFDLIRPNLDASSRKAQGRMGKRTGQESPKFPARQPQEPGKKNEIEGESEIESECECECQWNGAGGESDFDQFWSVYPKKVGKADARRAFGKVTEPVHTLVAAVRRQSKSAQWNKDGGQFIPNPATWLNQQRWEDELPPAGGVPMGASGVLGEAELENIRHLLQEGATE